MKNKNFIDQKLIKLNVHLLIEKLLIFFFKHIIFDKQHIHSFIHTFIQSFYYTENAFFYF